MTDSRSRLAYWRRKFRSASQRFQSQGLQGLALHIANRLYSSLWKKRDPREIEWTAHKDSVGELFDAKHEIDTSGTTELAELQIAGRNRLYGIPHIASDPEEFADAICSVPIRHEEFTFVDLGSGKGRALVLALSYPFRRIIGVEFAFELHRTAQANITRLAARGAEVGRISLFHLDATEFELPPEPLVIYLYNPFNGDVMTAVANRVFTSCLKNPRPIYVVYANAFLEKLWTDRGFAVLKRGNAFSLLAPSGHWRAPEQEMR